MNRMIRLMSGVMLVAAVAACNNDPSLDLSGDSGDPTKIQATPQIMFINQGETKNVLLRLTDDANFATPVGPYTITDVGPGLTVVNDSTYRPDYLTGELSPNPIQTQHRYKVTATQAVGTSFKVTNKGITQVITVNVIPTEIPVTFSAVSGGKVDVSSENFVFNRGTTFDFDGAVQQPLSVSADGHTATILATSGTPLISGARASYLPTVALPAVAASTGLTFTGPAGGATAATAPTITLPDTSFTFSDKGTLVGADIGGWGGPAAWYKLSVGSDRTLDITVDWGGGNDIDFIVWDATLNEVLYQGTSAHPEHNTLDVTTGDYYLIVVDYNTGGAPAFVKVTIK